jgi:hypothetical protein
VYIKLIIIPSIIAITYDTIGKNELTKIREADTSISFSNVGFLAFCINLMTRVIAIRGNNEKMAKMMNTMLKLIPKNDAILCGSNKYDSVKSCTKKSDPTTAHTY